MDCLAYVASYRSRLGGLPGAKILLSGSNIAEMEMQTANSDYKSDFVLVLFSSLRIWGPANVRPQVVNLRTEILAQKRQSQAVKKTAWPSCTEALSAAV